MPIYEYKCKNCGKITEIWHGVNESANGHCPHCGGNLQKIISNAGFILKGSGWYVTDYKRKNNNPPKSDKLKKEEKEKDEKPSATQNHSSESSASDIDWED